MRIIEIVAIRCQMFRLKCTRFDFSWVTAPDPAARAYSASPDPLAAFMEAYFYGKGGRGREGSGRKGREGEGRGVKGVVGFPGSLDPPPDGWVLE